MYSVDSLEYAIGELYRSGIGENSGLSADEVDELLDGIDFHALLQAVRHHAETVFRRALTIRLNARVSTTSLLARSARATPAPSA